MDPDLLALLNGYAGSGSSASNLGAALNGGGDPLAAAGGGGGSGDVSGGRAGDPLAAAAGGGAGNTGASGNLLNALKGAQALQPPQAQKVGTPAAPRPAPIQNSGQFFNLLNALGLGGQHLTQNYSLPSTIGTALGGRVF